jgi:hypothetical protein
MPGPGSRAQRRRSLGSRGWGCIPGRVGDTIQRTSGSRWKSPNGVPLAPPQFDDVWVGPRQESVAEQPAWLEVAGGRSSVGVHCGVAGRWGRKWVGIEADGNDS